MPPPAGVKRASPPSSHSPKRGVGERTGAGVNGVPHQHSDGPAMIPFFPLLVTLSADPAPLPSPKEMAAAKTDVGGEAARRLPDGPSYEYFRDLLPPVRYVNTSFRHYPIVLSAPRASVKARWVSNGSAVNARADKKPMWKEVGSPVHF